MLFVHTMKIIEATVGLDPLVLYMVKYKENICSSKYLLVFSTDKRKSHLFGMT